jgi:hypothetical protein
MVIMKAGRHRWTGYVNIMNASEMPERIRNYNPEGKQESLGPKTH